MYRARTHYTILDDLPTFGRAHHLPTFRVMIDSALTALGCLLCALGAVLDGIGRRFDRAGIVLLGKWRPDPTEVHAQLIQWEGATYSDHDTKVSLHLDPMADTEVSPALEERPVLADAMVTPSVDSAASESFPTQIPALPEIVQQTRSRKPKTARKPRAKVMPAAAQVTTADDPEVASMIGQALAGLPVAPVYTADIRAHRLDKYTDCLSYRFSIVAMIRSGWMSDGKAMFRLSEKDREPLAQKLIADGRPEDGRIPPVDMIFPKSVDPRPFVLVGRKWDGENEPIAVLRREDGATVYLCLYQFVTIQKHLPGCVIVQQPKAKSDTPLVWIKPDDLAAYRGYEQGQGMVMPLCPDRVEKWTDWTPGDERLTLSNGKGPRLTLTRAKWRAIYAGESIETLAKSDRAKLATLIPAGPLGHDAIARLLGEEAAAAA